MPKTSEDAWRRIFDSLTDLVSVHDREFRILVANEAVSKHFRVEPEKIVGSYCYELFHCRNDPWPTCPHVRTMELKKTVAEEIDDPNIGCPVLVTTSPIFDDAGEVMASVHVARDLSERRQAKSERERLQAQLQQAQRLEALGQLTGGIAHDFNNILASVLGYTDLAREVLEEHPQPDLVRYLGEIARASERAKELIAQLLAFSRKPAGSPRPLSVAPLVKEALKMLRPTLPASIDVRTHFELDVPPVVIDPTHVHQAIVNLCINARAAMGHKGTLCVSVQRASRHGTCASCSEEVSGEFVEICVQDTGPGLSPEVSGRIFEPFFTTKPAGEGTGMGLAVVHGIVHANQGHILVGSQPQAGSRFSLLWPLPPPGLTESPRAEPGPTTERDGQGRSAQILLVDDETSVMGAFKELLEHRGFTVTAISDPRVALGWYKARPHEIDLVLTDYTMPGLTGVELARELLSLRPELPVIMCTGYAELLGEDDVHAIGIRHLCQKPVDTDALARLIRSELAPQPPRPGSN